MSTVGAPQFELRIWVSRADYNTLSPATFNFGTQFDGSSNTSLFGYADIVPPNNVACGLGNSGNTLAPPWGTLNSNGNFSTFYESNQFLEMGVNLTAFGIDPSDIPGVDVCDIPFENAMYKSRASSSFTAQLKDFNGP